MKYIIAALVIITSIVSYSDINTDVYDITMNLSIPRVYDNMQSMGYRKYQKQKIEGRMYLTYIDDDTIDVNFDNFTNKTYKIDGKNVTYYVSLKDDELRNFSWCGNNAKDSFTKPNCNFVIEMEPSYKKGSEMLDDLHITIACVNGHSAKIKYICEKATVVKSLTGYCTGQLGCNCYEWGHISPTRTWGIFGPTDIVTDIATVNGTVKIKWNKKLSRTDM